jgi:D-alanine-D-alanine ligase
MKKVIILHDRVSENATKDEKDVLLQAEEVSRALFELGYDAVTVPFSLDLKGVADACNAISPEFVFNLVESVEGLGRHIHMAPALLGHLGLPYTGSELDAMFLTSNKLLAKKLIRASDLPTPAWYSTDDWDAPNEILEGPYIIKSVWEHASRGLDESSVVFPGSYRELIDKVRMCGERLDGDCFAERYVEGREFNLSLLGDDSGRPEVLPPAEIIFDGYPAEKIRVVGYRAKWEEDSFEYTHTPRSFDFHPRDTSLLHELRDMAVKCWNLLGVRGYARVDFRVDPSDRPWVLEVNVNPCLSPDAGFFAAARRANLDFTTVVERIVKSSIAHSFPSISTKRVMRDG